MSRFGEVDDQYDPHDLEQRVFEYWDDVDAYERTVEHRSDGESFFFVDGPPYTSGSAHMGTTWNKTLKDVYLRFWRMQGYDVTDRPGYDMHGLPIETRVEERLGFENKKDIEEFGEENFIQECKDYANEQLEGLQSDFQDFGVWMDWDDPYRTLTPEYMEAAWWGFSKAAERGLVEKGHRSISQCPRCETAIANNEVEYEDVDDPSVYVKFDLTDRGADQSEAPDKANGDDGPVSSDGKIVIWTTTPWTIPANTFVAVDEDGDYVGVRAEKDGEEELLYLAEAKHEDVLREGRYDDYEVVEELTGEDLIGWSYEHPLVEEVPDHVDADGTHEVYAADYVDTEGDGTGLVHSAPGHGEEDFERGRELEFPIFCPVGSDGVYTDEAGKYEASSSRTQTTRSWRISRPTESFSPRAPSTTATGTVGAVIRASSRSSPTSGSLRSRTSKTSYSRTSRTASGTPTGPATIASAISSKKRRTGTSRDSATGASRYPSGRPRTARTIKIVSSSATARNSPNASIRRSIPRTSICTKTPSTTSPSPRTGQRTRACLTCSTSGSIPPWRRGARSTSPKTTAASTNFGPPTSSSRPTTRPVAGSGPSLGWARPHLARVPTRKS